MPSEEFRYKIYRKRFLKKLKEERQWHFENPDYSPLCACPAPSKWWDGGAPKNGYNMKTTANVKYVTCRRCRKILAERGVELPELIEEMKENE